MFVPLSCKEERALFEKELQAACPWAKLEIDGCGRWEIKNEK
jgi:hypothetical protein